MHNDIDESKLFIYVKVGRCKLPQLILAHLASVKTVMKYFPQLFIKIKLSDQTNEYGMCHIVIWMRAGNSNSRNSVNNLKNHSDWILNMTKGKTYQTVSISICLYFDKEKNLLCYPFTIIDISHWLALSCVSHNLFVQVLSTMCAFNCSDQMCAKLD